MIKIKIITSGYEKSINSDTGLSLLDILRKGGCEIYAPCGGKGKCGKCRVKIKNEGDMLACRYYPARDIEVILPEKEEAQILVHQTKFLEDVSFKTSKSDYLTSDPFGVAIDIGTTTVAIYFLNLLNGQIESISSFLNPQRLYGADIISRINHCQEHRNGLTELQKLIINAINDKLADFMKHKQIDASNIEKIFVAGNTTMLHIFLGTDPVPIALAPFKPVFTDKQVRKGYSTGLNINSEAKVITLPCISAFVGADIVAGLAALKVPEKNYLFIDIGTNGEIALVGKNKIFTAATAAGPAFEGANISCGMGAVSGAISAFSDPLNYHVIGNSEPYGICGSGITDIVAYMIKNDIIDETGLLKEPFIVYPANKIMINQRDIREIQLAKSAIYSGIIILMNVAGLSFNDIDALYLAGGFGNYINIKSAICIGLLPYQLKDRIYPVGNSAGIGTLQNLKSDEFDKKIDAILKNSIYVELSDSDEFKTEFALNMNFQKNII
ncbi:MAG: ASKHA domain-containing protein [Bacteroidales bacterium]